jgi:hypothetical protein
MTQQDSGRDRLGRRAKRFLNPSEKYELWLQLVTGELSQSEAAERFGIDRSTVMRIRQVAKQGALEALGHCCICWERPEQADCCHENSLPLPCTRRPLGVRGFLLPA